MLEIDAETWKQLAIYAVFAGAVWGGIRMDIKHIHAKMADLTAMVNRAHERIDNFNDR